MTITTSTAGFDFREWLRITFLGVAAFVILLLVSHDSGTIDHTPTTHIDTVMKQYQIGMVTEYPNDVYVAWSTPWASEFREMCLITKEQYNDIQRFYKATPSAPLFLYCDWVSPLVITPINP